MVDTHVFFFVDVLLVRYCVIYLCLYLVDMHVFFFVDVLLARSCVINLCLYLLTCTCSSLWTCYWLDLVWLIFVFIWLTCTCSSSWTCYWLDLVWLIFVLHLLNYKDVYHVTHSLRLSASLIRSPRCTICKHIKGAILSCFHGLTLAQVVIV